MSPRPYTPVERQKTVDAGRERILTGARELLMDDDAEGFSIDAVARRAGVSRMTVYNQFESKAGLLEALFDSIAARGPFGQMSDVFAQKDPVAALDDFIALFGRFWTHSRRAHLRLRAAAANDPELAAALESRNDRRRHGLVELVRRISKKAKPVVPHDEVVNVLFVLLNFDTFDAFAGADRAPNDVVALVQRLAHAVLGLPKKRARKRVSKA
ncbi:MAG: TetR/AcrR family transcriptional regulator [Gemmatimonadetes bacterium]|nr:TetR/AcrR family transcriptional regulator [Gemmatimonadota bacterium]